MPTWLSERGFLKAGCVQLRSEVEVHSGPLDSAASRGRKVKVLAVILIGEILDTSQHRQPLAHLPHAPQIDKPESWPRQQRRRHSVRSFRHPHESGCPANSTEFPDPGKSADSA